MKEKIFNIVCDFLCDFDKVWYPAIGMCLSAALIVIFSTPKNVGVLGFPLFLFASFCGLVIMAMLALDGCKQQKKQLL